ncbi:hypothetical protein [Ornithinimicrobium cavernae]|uniref:hypothetical protein n=1 Tax=Ornithinimicrobium cavernae TaxID=2666047 RepID=UPI000D686CC5|nr:hypothetical protein [Ornithinimicrobium cavernae]
MTADLRRAQRRGRIVIVTIIALFLLTVAALGWFLVQREGEEARLAELRAAGLTVVALPDLGLEPHDLQPLERNRGLAVTYAEPDGRPTPTTRALTLRTGADPDPCALLGSVEPDLADGCEATPDGHLVADSSSPGSGLLAAGELRDSVLIVLVGDPADHTADELRAAVAAADLVPLEVLLRQLD